MDAFPTVGKASNGQSAEEISVDQINHILTAPFNDMMGAGIDDDFKLAMVSNSDVKNDVLAESSHVLSEDSSWSVVSSVSDDNFIGNVGVALEFFTDQQHIVNNKLEENVDVSASVNALPKSVSIDTTTAENVDEMLESFASSLDMPSPVTLVFSGGATVSRTSPLTVPFFPEFQMSPVICMPSQDIGATPLEDCNEAIAEPSSIAPESARGNEFLLQRMPDCNISQDADMPADIYDNSVDCNATYCIDSSLAEPIDQMQHAEDEPPVIGKNEDCDPFATLIVEKQSSSRGIPYPANLLKPFADELTFQTFESENISDLIQPAMKSELEEVDSEPSFGGLVAEEVDGNSDTTSTESKSPPPHVAKEVNDCNEPDDTAPMMTSPADDSIIVRDSSSPPDIAIASQSSTVSRDGHDDTHSIIFVTAHQNAIDGSDQLEPGLFEKAALGGNERKYNEVSRTEDTQSGDVAVDVSLLSSSHEIPVTNEVMSLKNIVGDVHEEEDWDDFGTAGALTCVEPTNSGLQSTPTTTELRTTNPTPLTETHAITLAVNQYNDFVGGSASLVSKADMTGGYEDTEEWDDFGTATKYAVPTIAERQSTPTTAGTEFSPTSEFEPMSTTVRVQTVTSTNVHTEEENSDEWDEFEEAPTSKVATATETSSIAVSFISNDVSAEAVTENFQLPSNLFKDEHQKTQCRGYWTASQGLFKGLSDRQSQSISSSSRKKRSVHFFPSFCLPIASDDDGYSISSACRVAKGAIKVAITASIPEDAVPMSSMTSILSPSLPALSELPSGAPLVPMASSLPSSVTLPSQLSSVIPLSFSTSADTTASDRNDKTSTLDVQGTAVQFGDFSSAEAPSIEQASGRSASESPSISTTLGSSSTTEPTNNTKARRPQPQLQQPSVSRVPVKSGLGFPSFFTSIFSLSSSSATVSNSPARNVMAMDSKSSGAHSITNVTENTAPTSQSPAAAKAFNLRDATLLKQSEAVIFFVESLPDLSYMA